MSWATRYMADLRAGKTVRFRPRGNSMSGKVESGQLCTVEPVLPADVEAGRVTIATGDILLCKVNGSHYLHLVKAVSGGRYQIGNNRGGLNGWIGAKGIFGRLTRVEP